MKDRLKFNYCTAVTVEACLDRVITDPPANEK